MRQGDITYTIDGTFDGVMCAVFECYLTNEIPADIQSGDIQQSIYGMREIVTDSGKAERVKRKLRSVSPTAYNAMRLCFLTCNPQRHMLILLFSVLTITHGDRVNSMLTDSTVNELYTSVRHLTREAHLYKGFVRFSVNEGVLTAVIEPKNMVLPLLRQHFCERFRGESFLIFDKTHGAALIYSRGRSDIIPIEALEFPAADEEERKWQSAWRAFYETIAIEERYNPKCRQTNMPKRYWRQMTEFSSVEYSEG